MRSEMKIRLIMALKAGAMAFIGAFAEHLSGLVGSLIRVIQ